MNSVKLSGYMNILSYYNTIVKYKASFLYYMYKGIFFFDFLRNTPYFIQLKKGSSLIQEGPLPNKKAYIYLCIKLLFVELIKKVYDKHKNL